VDLKEHLEEEECRIARAAEGIRRCDASSDREYQRARIVDLGIS
jgi:hypothetical protein